MAQRIMSAKGEIVDFELLKIRAQLEAVQPTVNAQARRDFIDSKITGKPIPEREALEEVTQLDIPSDSPLADLMGDLVATEDVATKEKK